MGDLIGIYTVGYSNIINTIRLEHLTTIDKSQAGSITDKQIEVFEISKYVNAFMYKCAMTHHFLMSTKKLPVAYINVCYTKYPLKVVLLYRIFLYFEIDSVEHIRSMNDLLINDLFGKFIVEASINNKMAEIEIVDEGLNDNNELYNKMINFTKSNEMVTLMEELIQEVEKAMVIQYKDDEMFKVPDIVIKRQHMEKKKLEQMQEQQSNAAGRGDPLVKEDCHLSDK